jgi:hypothetical protein
MQLRPGAIYLYDQFFRNNSGNRKIRSLAFSNDPVQKMYTGKLNQKSISKLRFAINLLIAQAKWKEVENPTTKKMYRFKINFITLTLSAAQKSVTDMKIKKLMLWPFIRNMRNVYKLRSYVWRAERQKNGNIHFHFATDTYIDYAAIRDAWNFQQGKFHFIREFQQRNKTEFPNSTDVKAVRNIKNLAAYLVKYMTKKNSGIDTIEGKVWDCSKNLKTTERVCFEMGLAEFDLVSTLLKDPQVKSFSSDNCQILTFPIAEMNRLLPNKKMKAYSKWIAYIYESAL